MSDLLDLFLSGNFDSDSYDRMKRNKKYESAESLKRRRACECSYDPFEEKISKAKEKKCSVQKALLNHLTFPSFDLMTKYDEPSLLYFHQGEAHYWPIRHWATLVDITHDLTFGRPGCQGYNQFGEVVRVFFYHDNTDTPTSFEWSDLQPNNTLAILYPERKVFLDMTEGIREENLDSCFIFKAPLKIVQEEAQKLLNNADMVGVEKQCFNCGLKSERLSHCANCKLANYCSKVIFRKYIIEILFIKIHY
jgi:hypothetical protein